MIQDLDSTLHALLLRDLPAALAEQVAISFDTPDDQFPPSSVTLPAIDLFMYDVRENLELRSNEQLVQRDTRGAATRFPPLVRVDCSYLITAWPSESAPNKAQDEHMLLGEVMLVLLRHQKLPADVLRGRLQATRDQSPPLPAAVLQPGRLQSVGEFWQALGGKPKSALNYTVTIAVQPSAPLEVPLAVESETNVRPMTAEENGP